MLRAESSVTVESAESKHKIRTLPQGVLILPNWSPLPGGSDLQSSGGDKQTYGLVCSSAARPWTGPADPRVKSNECM